MKVVVIFPSLDSTSITIIQMAGLQFFTFLINDQIVDMMGAYFIDEFYKKADPIVLKSLRQHLCELNRSL